MRSDGYSYTIGFDSYVFLCPPRRAMRSERPNGPSASGSSGRFLCPPRRAMRSDGPASKIARRLRSFYTLRGGLCVVTG